MTEETISQSTVKGRTYGAFRCLNCFERITAPSGATQVKCPKCAYEWRISWINPTFPRIRGPVWDVNKQKADDATHEKTEENE